MSRKPGITAASITAAFRQTLVPQARLSTRADGGGTFEVTMARTTARNLSLDRRPAFALSCIETVLGVRVRMTGFRTARESAVVTLQTG